MDDVEAILLMYTYYVIHNGDDETGNRLKEKIHVYVYVDPDDTPKMAFKKFLDSFPWNDTKRLLYEFYIKKFKLDKLNNILMMLVSD